MKNLFKRKKLRHDYVKGKPFFCQFEKIKAYPFLNKTVHTDVLIIGGGIIGAITNFYLSQHFDVVLVDKSRFGMCCTSCATVLLEYQLDDFADDLLSIMSEEEIVEVYKMGLFSIDKIQEFIDTYGNHCHFNKRPSLLYTNNIFGKKAIEKEFEFRVKHGFKAQLFNKENNPFSFDFVSGLYCEDGGAEINPYLFTKQMIENSINKNNLFENTEIENIEKVDNGYCVLSNFGDKIFCKRIIFATGYNFELFKSPALCTRSVSYTIVTNPLKKINIFQNALLQDDQKPYHYLRLLPDNRIIFGGEDTKYKGTISTALAEKKYQKLEKELKKLFPHLKDEIKKDKNDLNHTQH